ncbi:SU10 major capsid protein [Prevotella intermedia]|uniref:Uncharacterized protein n=1 Tax=Prevotella intermedia TaxID=28131 RepID=A0A2A6EF96_PREIN|nr:hypothetical protein [Prevotella intermedia]PDP60143.1 hypothetical protein CLI71_06875 [Prevotella intermedia]
MAEQIKTVEKQPVAAPGSAGLKTQMPGQTTTVDGISAASGGIGAGNLVETHIDDDIFEFESDDTPLCGLMLRAKRVNVTSPIVEHYQIDEEVSTVTTIDKIDKGTGTNFILPLAEKEKAHVQVYSTLHVRNVNGYTSDGSRETPGLDLQLYVTGKDTNNSPIVRCVNGPRQSPSDDYCQTPGIPKGTTIDILVNALHETQKVVPPDSVKPSPTYVYLQKRGMTQIVSDYFDSQRKRIPFSKALIAERALRKFKRATNRSLLIGRKGKMSVEDEKTGAQTVYFTEGIRWAIKRELMHSGRWTYEEFIALAKMFYTGEDVPQAAICVCGKNFLENIQCIDFSKHPEVKITVETNKLGWKVTNFHTVFGDFEFKHDPTFEKVGYSNSAAILGYDRLVHYVRSSEHSDSEDVEEREAKRETLIAWDALALKGSCHIFVNCEGAGKADNATGYRIWKSDKAPTGNDLVDGQVYYLLVDCPEISKGARQGETWLYTTAKGWEEYKGEIGL